MAEAPKKPTKEEEEKVKRDVKTALLMLAKAAGVPLRKREMPEVEVGDFETSSYDPIERKIGIVYSDIGDGISYFEEVSHALRDIVQRRKGIPSAEQNDKVQECYGRIGETLGRELTKGTELAYLFQKAPRDVTTGEFKKKWLEGLQKMRAEKRKAREVLGKEREIKEKKEYLRTITANNYDALKQEIAGFTSGKINEKELREGLSRNAKTYINSIKALGKISSENAKGVKGYLETYSHLNTLLNIAAEKSDKEKRRVIKGTSKTLQKCYKAYSRYFSTEQMEFTKLIGAAEKYVQKTQTRHRRAYLYGQQYSAQELEGVKGLYDLNDEEAKKVFFHKEDPYKSPKELEKRVEEVRAETEASESFLSNPVRYVGKEVSRTVNKITDFIGDLKRTAKRTLEAKVATLFFISLGLLLLYALNAKFTGFLVYSTANLAVGGILSIVSGLLLVLFLYFKIKKPKIV